MRTKYLRLEWPELPDEAVVALDEFLLDFIDRFQSHYYGQMQRHYQSMSQENRWEPPPPDPTDPPF